jgi:hypothetical protein
MKFLRTMIILTLVTGAAAPLAAQDAKMAALFVMSFARNVEWPASTDSTCVITILGDDPIYEQLQPLAAAGKIEDRTIVLNKAARIENITRTNILYISPDKSNQIGTAAAKFGSQPILLVTQKPGLGKEGASINITPVDGKLSFEINVVNLKKTGLSVKPLLFKVGKFVG